MDTLSYKTISANKGTVTKEWVLVDAKDQVLGRIASKVAKLIRGKYKPNFTPHVDCGDNVIVINADKIKLTGNKWSGRTHFFYSGHPGGRKDKTPQQIFDANPENLIIKAVKGMLPGNRLGNAIINNLHVFAGEEHTHQAQQPKKIDIDAIK